MLGPLLIARHDIVDLVNRDLKNQDSKLLFTLKYRAGKKRRRSIVGGQVGLIVHEVSGVG